MSDYYEHLEAAWNDLSKEDKERFISSNIRQQQPTPQDINKWQEAKLQQLREELAETKAINESYAEKISRLNSEIEKLKGMVVYWNLEAHAKFDEIEQQESQIDAGKQLQECKKQLAQVKEENGRLETDLRVAKLAFETVAAEIESLKQENERLIQERDLYNASFKP